VPPGSGLGILAATRPMQALTLRVPASTSNLGPGFDCLGLALSLFLEVALERDDASGASSVETSGPSASEWPEADRDLLLLALRRAERELGLVSPSGRLRIRTEIPVGRGFGSSGAAVAAGLLLANACAERPVTLHELHAWGVELEGHPDNVTASLFGGCTVCHPDPDGQGPVHVAVEVADSIGVVLAWPREPLETARARAALPAEVSLARAVENPRRLALLLEGLRTGDPALLAVGAVDHLHVRHRLPLIPGSARVLEDARAAGAWLSTVSGAGSGMVALGPRGELAGVAEAMERAFREESGWGAARVVDVVREAPAVRRQRA